MVSILTEKEKEKRRPGRLIKSNCSLKKIIKMIFKTTQSPKKKENQRRKSKTVFLINHYVLILI